MIMVEPGPSRRPRRHPPPQKQPPPQPRNRPAQNEDVIDEAELRRMTHDERRELARALAAIDVPHPLLDPRLRRRRRLGLLTLPGHYTSTDWQTVWVGLDIAELLAFAATAWAAWHERQVVIFLMIITGTLLVCDAWFDVTLSYGSSDFTASILSAVLVELPLAFLMFAGARRLVRVTVETLMELRGNSGPAPPLWRIPLFADGLGECLPAPLRTRADAVTAGNRPSS